MFMRLLFRPSIARLHRYAGHDCGVFCAMLMNQARGATLMRLGIAQ